VNHDPLLRPAARLARTASLLVVIDVQERLAPHVLGHEALIARTEALMSAAERFGIPRYATEHLPGRIGRTIPRLRDRFAPEAIFAKSRFGALGHAEFAHARGHGTTSGRAVRHGGARVRHADCAGLAATGCDVFVVGDAVGSRPAAGRPPVSARTHAARGLHRRRCRDRVVRVGRARRRSGVPRRARAGEGAAGGQGVWSEP
jgi:nicotinamidase-related amidase